MSEQFHCDIVQQGEESWCKPSFLMMGCQKCGSSSFFHLLKQHPNVRAPQVKELLYFQGNSRPNADKSLFRNHYLFGGQEISANCDALPMYSPKGVETYFQKFDDRVKPLLGKDVADGITGEFSATYFNCVCCAQEFKTIMPNTKLVVQLREPYSRALSRFHEQVAFGNRNVNGTTWSAFKGERFAQLKACLAKANTSETRAICAVTDNVFGWSLHSTFLQQFIDAGYNAQNLQVLYLDDMAKDGNEQMAKVEHFLSLPPHRYDQSDRIFNAQGHYGWGAKKMFFEDNDDADLKKFYAQDVGQLIAMCKKFGWDEPPASWKNVFNNAFHPEQMSAFFKNHEKFEKL